jgi:hypothetical protein
MRSVLILMVALVAAVACKSREETNPAMPEIRLTPLEALGARAASSQPDRSGLEGVRTTILFGDPSKPGMYSILLYVPAHTTIPAHSHRDNRMATVIIGTWRIGYGNVFDAAGLKELPPGSIYSEPGAHSHFAQTRNEPVLLHIVGYGPTNTIYVNQRGEPRKP